MIKSKVELSDIQERLLNPLWARATEIKQTDSIIVDSKSAEIFEAIDYNFDKFATAKNSQVGVSWRGLIFDNRIRTYLQQQPQGVVVEIGAKLNTR